MTALRPWTGWSRSRSAASPSRPLRRPASGRAWTVVPGASLQHHRYARARRLHDRSRAFAARARRRGRSCCARSAACSRSRKPFGARPTSTACRALRSSTRWIAPAPTSDKVVEPAEVAPAARIRCRCSCRSAPRTTSKASSTCVKMKAIHWDDGNPGHEVRVSRYSGRTCSTRPRMRASSMVEAAAETSEELMNKYLEGRRADRRRNQARHPRSARC